MSEKFDLERLKEIRARREALDEHAAARQRLADFVAHISKIRERDFDAFKGDPDFERSMRALVGPPIVSIHVPGRVKPEIDKKLGGLDTL